MSTILVVDDSPTALKLVSKVLATTGHHMRTISPITKSRVVLKKP